MRSSSSLQIFGISISPASVLWIAAFLLVAVAVGTASAQDAETVPANGPAAAAQGSTDADGDAGTEAEKSPDDEHEWLKDEEGRLYRVATFPKIGRAWTKPREGWVRLPHGVTLPLIKEDDDTFWVKLYKPDQFGARTSRTRDRPSQEELAEIEARYETNTQKVDRVRLVAFENGLPRSGQWRDGIDIADMNGDGHLDIVSGPPRKTLGNPVIFLGDGAGNWRHWKEATFAPAGYDYGDVTVADWNGDGHQDMALGVHLRGLLALVGDGKGHFELATEGLDFDIPGTNEPLAAFSSKALAAYDWNQDGRLDLLAQGEGPKRARTSKDVVQSSTGFRVFLNQGDGSWQAKEISPTGNRNFAGDFALTDLDGDGRRDVVTATSLLGNHWIVLRRTSDEDAVLERFEILPQRGFIDTVEAADFDGDGQEDLAMSYRASLAGGWRSGIDVLLRRAVGWERIGVVSLEQREPFRALAAGDLDGDGHTDIAALDDFGTLRVLVGKGDGHFDVDITLEGPPARLGCQGFDVHLTDLDGDGRADIVAAFAGESVGAAELLGSTISGCDGQGSLRAWKSMPVTESVSAE